MKWERLPLSKIADIFSGFAFKSSEMSTDKGIPLIKIKNIHDKKVDKTCESYLIQSAYSPKFEKYYLKEGDVLIAMTGQGSVGRIGKMRKIDRDYLVNQRVGIIRGYEKIVNSEFLYQILATDLNEKIYFNLAMGAGQPNLSPSNIGSLELELPPLPTQQKIASILSAYDDLIENNLKRIKLLEEAAQGLYREWFVRLRFPATADKPGWEGVKVVDGVPEGWERKKIGDYCKVARGSSPRPIADQKYFEGGTIPWVKIADATSSNIFIYETKQHVNEFGASFSRKLPPGSLIIAASGTLGFPMILGVEACIHDGWIYLIDLEEEYKIFQFFTFKEFTGYYNSNSYGAAIQNINTSIVAETVVKLPPKELVNEYNRIANPMMNQIDNLQKQNQRLREGRDMLLPRLMGGVLEV